MVQLKDIGLVAALTACVGASTTNATNRPWLDQSRTTEDRLKLFMQQLNETQKYAMVQGDTVLEDNGTGVSACIGHISGNSTLGVPAICMGDGPAGVGNSLDNVVVAASWNTSLQYFYGQALAQEHKSKARNVVLAPTINILRTPLWARAAETLSEDPFLTARMAVASTLGIQSQDMLACPKHFAAYNQDTDRFGLDPVWTAWDSIVSKRVLHELYLPAFKASVQEGKAASIMCSYNRLNGHYACENDWLLNTVLKGDWGFEGYVVADWYFSVRSTVAAVNGGLDISMPGGSLEDSYGFPAYYGELLVDAVNNGSVNASRIDDIVARLWRPMFEFGVVDAEVTGSSVAYARTQAHLDLAQAMVEDGSVLLKNEEAVLPLSPDKYTSIAIFGVDATNSSQVSENHGGFVIDSTMVVQSPLDSITARAAQDNITVSYSEGYPGTGQFPTIPSHMFGDGLNVTYWTTTDFSGPVNQTLIMPNITAALFPTDLWVAYPQVFSSRYEGFFTPNTSGLYHFSLTGQGDATLWIDGVEVGSMVKANFGNTVQATANLTANVTVPIRMDYSMGYSLSTGAYGITLGVDVGDTSRYPEAIALAAKSDISIVFVSDRWSEGNDNNLGLKLPGDQDALISAVAGASRRTIVVAQTNSAILMPWINDVDAIMEAWYGGQQIGLGLARLLFGDINPSGKLPFTMPKALNETPVASPERYPGVNLEAHYDEGLYVGYKWYDEFNVEPLFPFGHGLSYSNFSLSALNVRFGNDSSTNSSQILSTVQLSNNGGLAGKEVVQLYVSYPEAADEPPKLLRGFSKVFLEAGESREVTISVGMSDLMIWPEAIEDWTLVSGTYTFLVGFSATDIILSQDIYIGASGNYTSV
ncbi:glycoside hydrolase family 3-containing protein [Coleophoma crateriformis]|uniref:beta-glucosidase n=1 Tax=Coleophoma crateriformis TaxID=565419 RepID=A0A3D8RWZ2_9HELO|nr:glycoside hydrolase family 3-containing protein [Coleophoma crateriformis]